MEISLNLINFKSKTNTYQVGNHKVVEYYDRNNKPVKRIESDEFDRIVDSKTYSPHGKIAEHMHKDYYELPNEKGYIEHYKSDSQEYTRKAYTTFVEGCKHVIDEFSSKTFPKKSYINEFVYDTKNKLKNIITKKSK